MLSRYITDLPTDLPNLSVKSSSQSSSGSMVEPTPIFSQKLVDRCHVLLPDTPKPTSAIYYEGKYYVFVKFFPSVEVARQKAEMMTQRGSTVLLTRIPKGLVLWVHEPEARLAISLNSWLS